MRRPPIPLPDVLTLRQLFRLDDATGKLYWRKTGKEAGTNQSDGYRNVSIANRLYRTHRIVWKIAFGSEPPEQVDHINRDRSDNRPANLREADNSQQQANAKRPTARTEFNSKYRGVVWNKTRQRWEANIRVNGKRRHLGVFHDELEAGRAYERAAIEARGDWYQPQGIL